MYLLKFLKRSLTYLQTIHPSINAAISNGDFPPFQKLANAIPVLRKVLKAQKITIDPLVYCLN